MVFNYFTLFTALALSASAIFYSVTGLALIFAGAFIPVVIMGTILEVSKLVAAVWLHRNWNVAVWWLKMYLSLAVLILMFITSMGIFGYLSKSHIEQATASESQVAKIQGIEEHLILSNSKMNRWRRQLEGLVNGDGIRVDTVIAREQKELDAIYNRIEAEQAKIQKAGDGDIALQTQRLEQAAARKESAIKALGRNPSRKAVQRLQSQELSVASRAQKVIIKIQASTKELLQTVEPKYTKQLLDINERLSKLKNQSGDSAETIESKILGIEAKLQAEQQALDRLSDEKAILQSRTRQLEAEVGPIRYIAEFVYREDTTKSILEEAVRWVIVIIIVVFDPLAVLLLIATQYSFEERKKEMDLKKIVHEEVEHELQVEQAKERAKEWEFSEPPEPVMPENTVHEESEIPDFNIQAPEFTMTTESFNPYNLEQGKPLWDDDVIQKSAEYAFRDVPEEVVAEEQPEFPEDVEHVILTLAGEGYINFNGKVFESAALRQAHPELKLNFFTEVNSGDEFPEVDNGTMFLRTDTLPTKLFRYNGQTWDSVDKNLLELSAYSPSYIQKLIDLIAGNEYNPELLNEIEKQHIQALLS